MLAMEPGIGTPPPPSDQSNSVAQRPCDTRAQCEQVVMARMENGLVEPSPQANPPKGIYIARTLVQDCHQEPVRVMNAADRDQKLTVSKPHLNTADFQELEERVAGYADNICEGPRTLQTSASERNASPPWCVSILTQWGLRGQMTLRESYVGGSIATGRDRSHCKKHKCLETSTEWKMTSGKQYGLLSRYMECENT
jgi:hypothetical protein